jgi:DNA repair protein RecO (recombination protein O)
MRTYSVDAFVLRMRPLGEADRILTLFSAEHGKLTAVAKGVRKTQSKFGARLDFMARSALTLHAGRSLHVITSARLISTAWERVVEPELYSLASYIAEVIDGLCEPDLAVPELFDLLTEFQIATALPVEGDVSAPRSLDGLRVVMELRILSALGFAPELDACARCGTPLGRRPFAGGKAALSPEAGGLVCRRCLDLGSSEEGDTRRSFLIVKLTSAQFEALRSARDASLEEALMTPAFATPERATQAFVQHHLGRASKALAAAGGRR